jgi:hypothetical protein
MIPVIGPVTLNFPGGKLRGIAAELFSLRTNRPKSFIMQIPCGHCR